MSTHSLRRLTTVAVLALTSLSVAVGCTSRPVTPAAGQAPSTATPSATPQPRPTEVSPTPTPRATPSTRSPRDCLGAVIYVVHAQDTGPPWPTPCIAVGGIVRFEGLGPDGFAANPLNNISCFYAAGITVCRLIRTGTVRFTITRPDETRQLAVVVANASSPPRPSPACSDAARFTVDASDGGPPWIAECVKVGSGFRLENHGPDGFSVNPSSAVSCWYEAGVRECRFVRAATVTFTITREYEIRPLIVVVIR